MQRLVNNVIVFHSCSDQLVGGGVRCGTNICFLSPNMAQLCSYNVQKCKAVYNRPILSFEVLGSRLCSKIMATALHYTV